MDVCDFLYLEKFSDLITIFYGFITHKPPASGHPFYRLTTYIHRQATYFKTVGRFMFVIKTHLMVHLDALEQTKFLSFYSNLKKQKLTGLTLFWLGIGGGVNSGIGLI